MTAHPEINAQKGFLSHLSDRLMLMETRLISSLLAAGGINAVLVFDGPAADCPHCNQPGHCGLSQAA